MDDPVDKEELEEVEALEQAMEAWGVDRKRHGTFWKNAIQCVLEATVGRPESEPQDVPIKLPEDPLIAAREVFVDEFQGLLAKNDDMLRAIDTLRTRFPKLPMAPPFTWNEETNKYVMRSDFEKHGVQSIDLDPFQRFAFRRFPVETVLQEEYCRGDSSFHTVARSVVAHKACLDGMCVNCETVSLCWNSRNRKEPGFRHWKKLACSACGSAYEIKTAKNMSALRSTLKRGTVYGGSYFSAYHAIKNALPEGAKHYVAIMPKWPTGSGEQRHWPVYVAEVKKVMPDLKPKSFCVVGRCNIYSRMCLEEGSDRNWFDAPFAEYHGPQLASSALARLQAEK